MTDCLRNIHYFEIRVIGLNFIKKQQYYEFSIQMEIVIF